MMLPVQSDGRGAGFQRRWSLQIVPPGWKLRMLHLLLWPMLHSTWAPLGCLLGVRSSTLPSECWRWISLTEMGSRNNHNEMQVGDGALMVQQWWRSGDGCLARQAGRAVLVCCFVLAVGTVCGGRCRRALLRTLRAAGAKCRAMSCR